MSHEKPDEQELKDRLAKAQKPAQLATKYHAFYRGKMSTILKCPVRDFNDFSIWYTPGVATPCREIRDNPRRVFDLTNKGNLIAVVSDGSRVLGLGDIGPEAGLPVMEGKCLLFKYLGGVDAVPIMLDVHDPEQIIETVLRIQPGFGGINLEDIAKPKCFEILERLRIEARIPIWHDDQQGTATVTLAALMNALRVVGKSKENIKISFIGAGAANVACSRLIFAWGVNPANALVVDKGGILGHHRTDLVEDPTKWALCQITNAEARQGGIREALQDADVVIAYASPGPGVILPEWIRDMARDPIIFACSNPTPEIWPWDARDAGAAIVATGRSDFPNQVNNSLCFPAIFRGVLDVRAHTITDEMCFAAAEALADWALKDLSEDHILPDMMDMAIYPLQAAAVGIKAQELGIAGLNLSYEQLLNQAEFMIASSQAAVDVLMNEGCIPPIPDD